jgi:protein-histidine pros-kinase
VRDRSCSAERDLRTEGIYPSLADATGGKLDPRGGTPTPQRAPELAKAADFQPDESATALVFQAVFETGPDALLLVDQSGRIAISNRRAEELFGYGRADLIGARVEMLLPERFRAGHVGYREGYVADPKVRPMGAGLQLFARRKDGTEFPVEISLSPIRFGDRLFVASAIRDVTDRKLAEEALRRSEQERFAAMGRMAAFVAHQLNTPLTNISLLTASVRRMTEDSRTIAYLQRIDEQRRTAATIIRELSRLSTHAEIHAEKVDFRLLLDEAIDQIETLRKPSVEVVRSFPETPVMAVADRIHLKEVFVNLLKNALEATGAGSVTVGLQERGHQIQVSVKDTGSGMAPKTLEQLFRPFFTTKEKGAGTGLGLAFAKSVVNAHGGSIDVESRLGFGSTFTVTLPKTPPATIQGTPVDSTVRPD